MHGLPVNILKARKKLAKYARYSLLGHWSVSAIALSATVAAFSPAVMAQAPYFTLHIDAGPASETLTRLATQTGTQLLFPYDQLANIQTNRLDGRYSFRRALRTLLRGTNLRTSRDKNGTIVIYLVDASGKNIAGQLDRPPHTEKRQAEEPSQKPKTPENRQIPIEEIFVTSRKRSESIRDVPFSITAQTEATIFLAGAENMSDLARGVSGLTFTDLGPGQSQIAIRGVSSGQVVRDQPGIKEQVGVYLDETAISMALFTPDLDFFDMKRVEVLRGPQGTLFGSGSLAGTVRYISNAPDSEHSSIATEATLAVTEGGDTTAKIKAVFNQPLPGNKGAVRLVAYLNELPGYIDAVGPNGSYRRNVNKGTKFGGRAALKLEVNDRLSITPRLVYQKLETHGFPRADFFNVLANPYTRSRPAVTLQENAQYIQLEEGLTDDFLLLDTLVKYDFDTVTLTSISSVIDRDITVVRDSGQLTTSILAQPTAFGLSGPVLEQDAPLVDRTDFKLFSQEARISSESHAPFQYVLGGFYTRSDRAFGQTLIVDEFENLTGIPAIAAGQKDLLFFSRFKYDFSQWALFGEASYHLNSRLSLTAGLRWFEFTEKRTLTLDGLFAAAGINETVPAQTVSNGLTPRFILSFKASEEFQLNAQIAKGFRLGGINDPLNQPLCTPEDFETYGNRPFFKNEELWNYEIGMKSTLAGGRLTFDTAIFYADIRNLQATVDAGSCSSRIIFNIPRARSIGIETEVFIRPHPNFDISLSATLQNAQIRSTLFAVGMEEISVLNGISQGNRLPTSPTFQAAAQFSYHWTWGQDWNGFAALSLQHVGSSFTQIGDQVPGFGTIDLTVTQLGDPSIDILKFDPELPAYQTGSIRLGVRKGSVELSAYVSNFWNQTIRTSLDRERGGLARIGHTLARPRTAGITLRTSF